VHRGDGATQARVLERRQPADAAAAPEEPPQQPDETAAQERLRHRAAARAARVDLVQQLLERLPDRIVGGDVLDERLVQVVEEADRAPIRGADPDTGAPHVGPPAVLGDDARAASGRHHDDGARGDADRLAVGDLQAAGAAERVVDGGTVHLAAIDGAVAPDGVRRQRLHRDFESVQELLEGDHRVCPREASKGGALRTGPDSPPLCPENAATVGTPR